jgi:hypothetical protein
MNTRTVRRGAASILPLLLILLAGCGSARTTTPAPNVRATRAPTRQLTLAPNARGGTRVPNDSTGAPTPSTSTTGICAQGHAPAFIQDVVLAKNVVADQLIPDEVSDTFAPTQSKFHAVVLLKDAPANTILKAVWYVVNAKGFTANSQIDAAEQRATDSLNVDFTLSPQSGAWPLGNYCVEIYANNALALSKQFRVEGAIATTDDVIVEVSFAQEVDPDTFAPVNPTRIFTTDATVMHCIVQIQDAPLNTKFRARWILPDGSAPKEWTTTAQGSRRLDLTLTPGNQPFPRGDYKVEIYVNDKLDRTATLRVE